MTQRPAHADDVPRLLELMANFYAEDAMSFVQQRADDALRRLIADRAVGWVTVTCHSSTIVGYLAATLGYSLEFGGPYGLIDEVYVHPDYRNHGLGTALIEEMLRACAAKGLVAVRLELERVNDGALRLYHRLGFEKHDRDLMTRLA
jgi:ribosomal protein S18 acetylase RimI-like enzyme